MGVGDGTASTDRAVIGFDPGGDGGEDEGVDALDNSKVSFRLWAHAVAKLNPDNSDIAAQRVGLDTTGLVHTITKVGTAELVAAAATMNLDDIMYRNAIRALKLERKPYFAARLDSANASVQRPG